MDLAVSGQGAHASERLVTDGADEQFLSGVDGHVVLQRSVLAERLVADRALVRSLSRVNASMRRQAARRREPVLADVALEGLFTAV